MSAQHEPIPEPGPRPDASRATWASRAYRCALWVFPARIRDVHGEEMEEMFADAWHAARRRGPRATLRLLARTTRDLTLNGLAARIEGGTGMETWGRDLRHALRGLARRPGFTAVAVLTLTLGIGGNTAIYSIVDAAYLDALPFPDDQELVVPYNAPRPDQGGGFAAFSAPFHHALEESGLFTAVAAIAPRGANLGGTDRPERVATARVSASFFQVVGTAPGSGRAFGADEDRPGGPPVVVLSHGLWTRRFAADPGLVGRTVLLDDEPTTVVGVMPEGFGLLFDGVEAWTPMRADPATFDATSALNNNRVLVARMPSGVDAATLAGRLPAAVQAFRDRFPDAVMENHAVRLVPLREHLYGSARDSLFILLGAVGLVLLIACANLANLLLVRAEGRRAEIALRAALGASRARLVRGLLTESLVLAVAGAALGCALAVGVLELVRPLAPSNVPLPESMDASVLAFTLGVAVATGLLFGMLPARAVAGRSLRDPLVEGGRGGSSIGRARARSALVVAEVALTAVLLAGSGLLLRSLSHLQSVDPGFGTEYRTALNMALPGGRYPDATTLALFYRTLLDELNDSPAVGAAGLTQFVPLSGSSNWGFVVEDREDGGVGFADYTLITPGYLESMDMEVVRGRALTWEDADPDAVPVLLVSEAMARRLWPDAEPVGRRLSIDPEGVVWHEVVGVVSDVRNRSLAAAPSDLMYFPPVDLPMTSARGMSLVVHHPGAPAPLTELRRVVSSLDPGVPLTGVRALDSIARGSESRRVFMLTLLGIFAGLALCLAAVGLYGVVAYTMSMRTREIGLRMAMGAGRGRVLGMVAGQGAALAGGGLVVGLVGAVFVTRLLGSLLYEVGTTDPATYGLVALFLLVVATVATWVPAARATSVDPAAVLRE